MSDVIGKVGAIWMVMLFLGLIILFAVVLSNRDQLALIAKSNSNGNGVDEASSTPAVDAAAPAVS